jgi:hypothetical protein
MVRALASSPWALGCAFRDDDVWEMHSALYGPSLLFRMGNYWWNGSTWYRPGRVWDPASEQYSARSVTAATTVTVADLLQDDSHAIAGDGQLRKVGDIDLEDTAGASRGQWREELARWASRRDAEALPLSQCVVTFTAPELSADQLVGIAEMAEIAGIAASTLRAYISRGEGDLPQPQAVVNARTMWARPVALEWAERRRRSPEGVESAVSVPYQDGWSSMPEGVSAVWQWMSRMFFGELWNRSGYRKRWALRWRTKAAVREVSERLAWDVAASLRRHPC